jgi:hypothetical protein
VDTIKDRINNRTLWAALEQTTAIAAEEGILVLGYSPENSGVPGVVQHPATLHAVTNIVQEVFGHRLQVKLIEGSTPEDWTMYKEKEAQAEIIRKTVLAPKAPAPISSGSGSWEAVYEQMSRMFAQTHYRALPQGKARYANEALYILLEAMDKLYPVTPDDAAERSLARVLERIASSSEIPAPVLAFELERLRAWRASEGSSE